MNLRRLATILAVPMALSGCATLINGTHQSIPVSTDPPVAEVKVGGQTLITPVTASLARDHDYQVIVSAPGYATQTAQVTSHFSYITLLDTIFIVPWIVDVATGSDSKLEPASLDFHLQPIPNERAEKVQ